MYQVRCYTLLYVYLYLAGQVNSGAVEVFLVRQCCTMTICDSIVSNFHMQKCQFWYIIIMVCI